MPLKFAHSVSLPLNLGRLMRGNCIGVAAFASVLAFFISTVLRNLPNASWMWSAAYASSAARNVCSLK